MKPSLKLALYNAIKCYDGQIYPFNEAMRLCEIKGYRQSNGERRLRELSDPPNNEIETLYHPDKHYIIGYRIKKTDPTGQMCFA